MAYDKSDQAGKKDPFLSKLIGKRYARGWTTRILAGKLGVSPAFISLVENGQKTPSEELARKWARLLDIHSKIFLAWVYSRNRRDPRTMLRGSAEYRYYQTDPNVEVRIADFDQVAFESAEQHAEDAPERRADSDVELVPLIPEGTIPAADDPDPPEFLKVARELLRGERLIDPFAYRLSSGGMERVFRTLHPGDYAVISQGPRPIKPGEIYAVRTGGIAVLSRIIERPPDILVLLSDRGEQHITVLRADKGKARSLVVGRVVVAIRPLQYSVIKPRGESNE